MGYGARMLPQTHMGVKGSVQHLGCRLMSKVAKRFCHARAAELPWNGSRSNGKTKSFIAGAVKMATGGFWTTVVARDWGVIVPRSKNVPVFDTTLCTDVGDNGVKGLNAVPPRMGKKTAPADRLPSLHSLVWPEVESLLGSRVLECLPPVASEPQFTEHNACEWMQQRTRKTTSEGKQKSNNVAKPRRCNEELKRFARAALPRLGVKRLPKTKAGACSA